jgi:iron complex outermembrane receptor protein
MKQRILLPFLLVFLISGLFLPPGGLFAQNTDLAVTELEKVVVTATRQEEKISSVPANVSVITEADIANSPAQDVPDLLRTAAGVHVRDISGNRRSYTVDLRGFGETAGMNTLVMVDGRRINQADLSGTDWTLIPIERIKRIEIIRGGRGSVLYGDNAAGGAINIITKKGKELEAVAEVAAGSYDTQKASANLSGGYKNLSYALSGNYMVSDGYRDNSDRRGKDAGINLDYSATPNLKFYLSSGYHKDKTGLPGGLKDSDFAAGKSRRDTNNPDDFAEIKDYYIKAGPEYYFLDNSFVSIDFSYRNRQSLFYSSYTGGNYEGDTEIDTVSVSPKAVIREKIFGFNNNLILGADFLQDEEDIDNTSVFMGFASNDQYELERKNYGIYIHDEFYVTPDLALSGGYRYDRTRFEFSPSSPDKTTTSEDLYTAGITYYFMDSSQVYASYSRSFRNPVLDEFFNFQYNTINTELKPQTADNYEIGVRHEFSDSFYGQVSVFRIDTKNEILYNPMEGFFGANANLDDEVRRDGVELSVTKAFDKIELNGTYSYTDAEIRGGAFDGNDFPGVPEHQASITTVFYPIKNLSLALNGVYVGKQPFISDFENNFDDQDDYVVANAKIRYKWGKISTYLDVNNIFDQEYEEYGVLSLFSSPVERAYYPSPKINFLLGFAMEL